MNNPVCGGCGYEYTEDDPCQCDSAAEPKERRCPDCGEQPDARGFCYCDRPQSSTPSLTLPTDSAERKSYPLHDGCLAYFPAALAGVARHSKAGNDKHNPGEPLHHARGKSMDHKDCILRHLVDLGDLLAARNRQTGIDDRAILDEVNALAWRALALSQELHERMGGAPLAPGAR